MSEIFLTSVISETVNFTLKSLSIFILDIVSPKDKFKFKNRSGQFDKIFSTELIIFSS